MRTILCKQLVIIGDMPVHPVLSYNNVSIITGRLYQHRLSASILKTSTPSALNTSLPL